MEEERKYSETKINYIDLFAGTGAFTHVFKQYNKYRCVFSNDKEKNSESIYCLNNPECNYILDDINDIEIDSIPEHNILCAGFPCQPFSIAGKREGFNDERSNVFWTILKILRRHNPDIIILENVKNLRTHNNGDTYRVITDEIRQLGYYIKDEILDTCKITYLPQHRERIYIICFKDKRIYDEFSFDFNEVENIQIIDLLENNVSEKYYYTDRFKIYDKIKDSISNHISENTIYQYRRHYIRENKSNVCPTLTANMGSGGHNVPLIRDDNGIRKLTPRECFNLQGFPTNYILPNLSDSALYKLAGNAVSIPVIELIINKLNDLL